MSQDAGHPGASEPVTANRAGEAPETIHGEECELCGAAMYGLHCKLICANCGYRRDCSDP